MLLAPAETASLVLGGLVGLVGAIWIWLTLSLGAGLLVLVVGVVFLGLALFGSAWLSRFHRARIAGLLGVVIPEPSLPAAPGWRGRAALLARAAYAAHRRTGAFLVIDPQDGNTLAAGMVGTHPGDTEDERYWI